MVVSEGANPQTILWQANFQDKIWFKCILNPVDFRVLETSDLEKSDVLRQLFKSIKTLDPRFVPQAGTNFETTLEANPEWGFGSSSTLISLLSQWAGVDPFALNEMVFRGSGFDIACATADGPIFYTKNNPVQPVAIDYPFSDKLFLVYSGQKKKTVTEVSAFLKERKVPEHLIGEVSALSNEFADCLEQDKFNQLIIQHEKLIGDLIGQTPVNELFFADFDGAIKSLGAWGGDFFLVSSALPFSGIKEYFENKGMTTLFRWGDLILKRQ